MAVAKNITRDTDCPLFAAKPAFWVEALNQIMCASGRLILPGEHVLIDPETYPSDGTMVLSGNCLSRWDGQSNISGTAVMVCGEVTA